MAAVINYLDPVTGSYIQIPIRPTAQVISVNGKNGIVDLAEADIPNLSTDLAARMVAPTDKGSAGQVLKTDGANNYYWADAAGSVESVNGKTGVVVLNSTDILCSDGKTVEAAINSKITNPTTGTAGQYLKKTASGEEWADVTCAVESVNGKTGIVVLTYSDVNAVKSPTAAGTAGQILTLDTDGVTPIWKAAASAPVTSVNTLTGDVVLTSGNIKMADGTTTLETAINAKVATPTGGIDGQVLAKNGSAVSWVTIPVTSVNTKTGDVVLAASDIKMADSTTVEAKMAQKMDAPISGSVDQVLTKTAAGYAWADAPVKSVNAKTGTVVLTGADINIDGSRTTKLSSAILEVQVNGTALTPTSNVVNIPLAGASTSNTAGTAGVVKVESANGIEIDTDGVLQFNSKSLAAIDGAYKTTGAAEYDETVLYQVGAYVTYKGRLYVCKVSNATGQFDANFWNPTSTTAEVNNLLAQLIAALGLKEGLRRWDNTNSKIIYDFEMN